MIFKTRFLFPSLSLFAHAPVCKHIEDTIWQILHIFDGYNNVGTSLEVTVSRPNQPRSPPRLPCTTALSPKGSFDGSADSDD